VRVTSIARGLCHLDALILLCDPLEQGGTVTSASLADDLKGRTAAQIQERLLAYGVESTFDSCAELQVALADDVENGAPAIVESHQEPRATSIDVNDGASGHAASVGPRGAA
jgi:hypothetical protein